MYRLSTRKTPILAIVTASVQALLVCGCESAHQGGAMQSTDGRPASQTSDESKKTVAESTQLQLLDSKIAVAPKLVTTKKEPAGVDADAPAKSDEFASRQTQSVRGLPLQLFRDIKTTPIIHTLQSAGGRDLAYWVFGEAGPVTLILGGMHGTENTPTVLSAQFIEWLEATPDAVGRGRIVIAPLVDPDGFESHRRGNDNGVDLNRNYPAKNWRMRAGRHGLRPLSESESRFVMELLEKFEPHCIVSIHAPLACVNYDGPAEELARRMSHACGLPVRASVGYATPGSFGSYAGIDREIPTITLELRPGRALDPDFDACRKALMAAHEYSLEQMPEGATD